MILADRQKPNLKYATFSITWRIMFHPTLTNISSWYVGVFEGGQNLSSPPCFNICQSHHQKYMPATIQ